jgi:hypothetical protein
MQSPAVYFRYFQRVVYRLVRPGAVAWISHPNWTEPTPSTTAVHRLWVTTRGIAWA